MNINQYIWNHLVLTGRVKCALRESKPPNSGLRDYLKAIEKLFGEENTGSVITEMASLLISQPKEVRANPLRKKIIDLAAQEPFDDNSLREKLPPKVVNSILKKFASEKEVLDVRKVAGGETILTLPTEHSVIAIEFENYSKRDGLRYSVRLYPKDLKRTVSTCMAYFVSESIWGYGVGRWDLLFEQHDLETALDSLFKNVDCIRDGLFAYEQEIGDG